MRIINATTKGNKNYYKNFLNKLRLNRSPVFVLGLCSFDISEKYAYKYTYVWYIYIYTYTAIYMTCKNLRLHIKSDSISNTRNNFLIIKINLKKNHYFVLTDKIILQKSPSENLHAF